MQLFFIVLYCANFNKFSNTDRVVYAIYLHNVGPVSGIYHSTKTMIET